MVDLILVVLVVFGMGQTLARQTGVVAHEARPPHQHVQNEAHQHHGDGNAEEDDGVLLLVLDQQFGEDSAERNDDSRRACARIQIHVS